MTGAAARARPHFRSMLAAIALSFVMGLMTATATFSLRDRRAAERQPPAVVSEPVEVRQTYPPTHRVVEAVPPSSKDSPSDARAIALLGDRDLEIPVDDVDREDLRDTFTEARGSRSHEALDIIAPRHTKVRAVENGRIQKLFTSKAGGLTIYEFDPTETFAYYYAHLDRYADGLREGQIVRRGDVIGYVGTTGNASPDAPHLHFAIFRLTPERQWWKGDAINPYPILSKK
jgi:peptidoglycan LD-endopeptidase LytH